MTSVSSQVAGQSVGRAPVTLTQTSRRLIDLDGFVRHARQLGGDIALYDPNEPGAKPDAVVMVMAENPTPKGRATSILGLQQAIPEIWR